MKKHRTLILTVLIAAAFFASSIWVMADYRRDVERSHREEIRADLTRYALEEANLLNARIASQSRVLRAYEGEIETGVLTMQSARAGLSLIADSGRFDTIALVDGMGQAVLSDGTRADFSHHPLVRRMWEQPGELVVMNLPGDEFFTEDMIGMAVPTRDGGLLAGFCNVSVFRELFESSDYAGGEDLFIIDRTGNPVLSVAQREATFALYKNLLDYYDTVIMADGLTAEEVRAWFAEGQGGFLRYSYGNQHRYVAATPLVDLDWMLVVSIPMEIAERTLRTDTRKILGMMARILVMAALSVIVMLLNYRMYLRNLARERGKIRCCEETMRAMAEMSGTIFFSVDIENWNIRYSEGFERYFQRKPQITSVDQFMSPESGLILPDDLPVVQRLGQAMKRFASQGRSSFRLPDSAGHYDWFRVEYRTLYDEAGRPIGIAGRVVNIEEDNRARRSQVRNGTDPVTRLPGYDSFCSSAQTYLSREGDRVDNALLVVDVDDFSGIENRHGPSAAENLLHTLAQILTEEFREGDLICRNSDDEFDVLVKDVPSEDWLRKRALRICEALNERTNGMEHISGASCSIGVAVYHAGEKIPLERLSRRANKALYNAKLNGRNTFSLYHEMLETARRGTPGTGESALISCLANLITAPNLDVALSKTLSGVGAYYQADRTVLLEIAGDGSEATLLAKWMDRNYQGFAEEIGRYPIAGNLLGHAAKERTQLTIPEISVETVPDAQERFMLKENQIHALFLEPVIWEDRVVAFLLVENPHDRIGASYLLKSLADCLWPEVLRRRDRQKFLAEGDHSHA